MPRYLPDDPLPPYTYVSGRWPHPVSDPRGHLYGEELPAAEPLSADAWRESRVYLRGIDLFNHGYYWEAHETWEALWLAAGRKGAIADCLKGLIKLAAAGVKTRERRPVGVERHARRAARLFAAAQAANAQNAETYLGLNLPALIATTKDIAKCADDLLEDPLQAQVIRTLPVTLELC